MFNTMTITKAAGALIGSLLFLMLLIWAAEGVYHMEEEGQAFTIEVATSDSDEEEEAAPAELDVDALMAAADPAAGEKDFGKCKACHKLDGSNSTGPHLDGVVGRAIASVDGFNYSDAMKAHAGEVPDWTPDALIHYLTNPKAAVPGNKMAFAGFKNPQDIADLISYLETQK